LLVLMAAALVALLLFAGGSLAEGRAPRIGPPIWLPIAFLVIPLVQSVPLGLSVRGLFDPRGTAILTDSLLGAPAIAPLSLDPPATRVDVGKAAVALIVFLFAYHAGSGQRRRHLFPRAIAAAGIAAVLIGIGHRVFGITSIYGLVPSTMRTLVIGPFVNSNHTAELLELSAFVCLACAFQRPMAFLRVAWMAGAVLCLGGTAATLSRGGVLGVCAGALAFALLRFLARERGGERRRRSSLVWAALVAGLVVLGATALGADQLAERFQSGSIAGDVRFKLWRDSLHVLAAHPFGVGRGAFERVYPIYRTVRTSFPLRFSFVENQPLQLLLDSGWFFFAALAVGVALAVWPLVRFGRRDRIEAALVAALVAVCVHSLFDFGLETLGVVLPFMAVLGTVLGRVRPVSPSPSSGRAWPVLALATLGVVFGIAAVAHASNDNFDALLRKTTDLEARRHLLERAQRAHPTDYIYVLAYARLEQVKPVAAGPSPRLHALNRALLLCPQCETIHAEVARNLWRFGLHPQALLEWRSAVELQPEMLDEAFRSLFAAGANPQELASIAAFDPALMVEVAHLLSRVSRHADAISVLNQAEAMGGPPNEILITRAELQLQLRQLADAAVTLGKARAAGIRDPRLSLLQSQDLLATQGEAAADQALAILDDAAARYPGDLPIQRARVELVRSYSKWRAVDRALEGLKQAVYQNQGSATEAHIAAGRIYAQLSRWKDAINEYQMAIIGAPDDVQLWMEFGGAAASAGRTATARDAYAQAARLSPQDPAIKGALRNLDEHVARLRMSDGAEAAGDRLAH
jgi:tetratricopeptide (TPR) repeat protein